MTGLRHRLEGPAQKAWPPLFLAAVIVVTWILVDRFGDVVYQTTAGRMLLMLIIVLGLQMFSGNSGVLSFGHITFVAIGAYSSALLTIPPEIKEFSFLTMPNWLSYWIFPAELSPLEGTLAGGGFAALFALIVAPAIVRLRGVQAGIATLALLVIANVFIVQTSSITRGTSTQIGVPTSTTLFSLMVWALIFIALAFVFRQSRFGLRLRASRENERAARSVGVRSRASVRTHGCCRPSSAALPARSTRTTSAAPSATSTSTSTRTGRTSFCCRSQCSWSAA